MVMEKLELKLKLEGIYKEFCLSDLNFQEDEGGFLEVLRGFVDFRLYVSGGSESSMGRIGCESIEGFLNEIFLYEDMVCDYVGSYRGEFCWEGFDHLEELLIKNNIEESIINKILEGYREKYNMDEE